MNDSRAIPATSAERLDSSDGWILLGIAIAYLALVGGSLAWHGYWSDEFHTIRAIERPWGDMIRARAAKGHPPLFYLLEKAWIGSAHEAGEIAYRALPMFFGLGSVVLTYGIVRGQASRRYAVLASVLLMSGGTDLLVCQLARSYTLLQLLATANMALVLKSQRATPGRLLASALLCAAAFYTHGAARVAIFAQLLAVAVAMPARWKFAVAGAAGSFLYLPLPLLFPRLEAIDRHLDWVPPATAAALLRFPALLQFGRQIGDAPLLLQFAAAIAVLAAAFAGLRSNDGAAALALQWFFTWAAAAAAGAWGIGIVHVERYFAPALVCQAAVVALALDELARRHRTLARAGGAIFGGIALASAVMYFALPPFTPWREMADLVAAKRRPDEAVIVLSPAVLATPFAYYYPGDVRYHQAVPPALAEAASGIWICSRPADHDIEPAAVPRAIQETFARRKVYPFHSGTIVHFSGRAQNAGLRVTSHLAFPRPPTNSKKNRPAAGFLARFSRRFATLGGRMLLPVAQAEHRTPRTHHPALHFAAIATGNAETRICRPKSTHVADFSIAVNSRIKNITLAVRAGEEAVNEG